MKKKNAYFQPDIVNLEKDKNLKLFHLNTTKVKTFGKQRENKIIF